MIGELAVLSVGHGDTKLIFDPDNAAETIRASRIVKDMLRRGYALLVEVDDGKGGKKTTRVRDFDEKRNEYIIADFDPVAAAVAEAEEETHAESEAGEAASANADSGETGKKGGRKKATGLDDGPKLRPIKTKRIPAAGTRGVAVGRTAGG